MVQLFQQI